MERTTIGDVLSLGASKKLKELRENAARAARASRVLNEMQARIGRAPIGTMRLQYTAENMFEAVEVKRQGVRHKFKAVVSPEGEGSLVAVDERGMELYDQTVDAFIEEFRNDER